MRNSTRAARICQSFDAAEKYDQAATVQRVAARELFQRIHTCMAGKKPMRILEIGCGTGLLTEHLRACWPDADILATDFAPNMLARAKSRLGKVFPTIRWMRPRQM